MASGYILDFFSLLKLLKLCFCCLVLLLSLRSKPHACIMQLSSSTFLGRSSGSVRRAAISSSREMTGNEVDPSRPRTMEASAGGFSKVFSGQRSAPIGSSEPKRSSSGRNASNTKNYESTLKGLECLSFDNNERIQY